jgi:hypothetical protein
VGKIAERLFSKILKNNVKKWCGWSDSNRQRGKPQWILSPPRMPISPQPHRRRGTQRISRAETILITCRRTHFIRPRPPSPVIRPQLFKNIHATHPSYLKILGEHSESIPAPAACPRLEDLVPADEQFDLLVIG